MLVVGKHTKTHTRLSDVGKERAMIYLYAVVPTVLNLVF